MIEALSLVTLVLVFATATVLPINMGVLAFTAAFLLGAASGLSVDQVLAEFPGEIFVLVVGITLLFGIARVNGTMDLFLRAVLRPVGDRRWAVPWMIFFAAGVLMSLGFVLAVGILAPMAMSLAGRYRVKPLLMAMMVSHGALAASLSPATVYANFTREIAEKAAIGISSWTMFAACFAINLLFAVAIYTLLGRDLRAPLPVEPEADVPEPSGTGGSVRPGPGSVGTGLLAAPATVAVSADQTRWPTVLRVLTIVGIVGLVVGAALGVEVGVWALVASTVLLLLSARTHAEALKDVGWNVILLVCGMLTLMAVLTANGTVDMVADAASSLGMPLLAALLILVVVGLLSAVGSSIGTIGIALPLAFPLVQAGGLPGGGLVVAIAICSLIVDVSPFSTNGALVLTNAEVPDRRRFQNRMLAYTGAVCVAAPVVLWLALVVPGGA